MIKEFLSFANAYQKADGLAIFLLTSLCDVHEAFHLMQSTFAKIEILAVRQFDFREHYLEHRAYWQEQRKRNKSLFFRDGDKECEIVMAISLSSPLKGTNL